MRRILIAASLFAPILAAAGIRENGARIFTTANPAGAVEWRAAAGPADPLPLDDAGETPEVSGLTVHEWGTFTSVAGPDGMAIQWLPAGGPTDLPCFVHVSGAGLKGWPDAEKAGRSSRARIRMETPVLYFYAPRQETVQVKVSFPRGLMTEWYPASSAGPVSQRQAQQAFPNVAGAIEWKNVLVMPGAKENFLMEAGPSHYYAARRTDSAPVRVGAETEKFLFYRGIADFTPPISVRSTSDGTLEIANLGQEAIPSVIVFENRNGAMGYRMHRDLKDRATLEAPMLSSDFASLQRDLEALLREQGMYPLEARAMVDTWKDTWFEQGTRVFYIVPPATVDALLPLDITPKPVQVARAFVGRVEVVTPATIEDVRTAVQQNDRVMLEIYGRFLEPILNRMPAPMLSEAERARAMSLLQSIRAGYVAAVTACSRKQHSW